MRTATVTTLAECQLLSLDVADFRRLLENNPSLKATITRTAEERLGELQGRPASEGSGDGRPARRRAAGAEAGPGSLGSGRP